MAGDQGPVVKSALLRSELIRLREARDLTQKQVASGLEWSPSKLIRVEGGHSLIRKVDLDALLSTYGVTSESHRDRLHALNRGAHERAWWDNYKDDFPSEYLSYVGFEAGAAIIKQFHLGVIPALLQTVAYSESVTVGSQVQPGRVKSIAGLRMQRQAELARRSAPPRQYFVIDEGAIRRHIGVRNDPGIMPSQLRHVADRAERDDLVTVRIIPFAAGAHPGLVNSFNLLEFDGGLPDILFLDGDRVAFTMIDGGDPRVALAQDDFKTLEEIALPAERSIDMLRGAADALSCTLLSGRVDRLHPNYS
jgi:transcriptional regulator with XRE-family HTH domain